MSFHAQFWTVEEFSCHSGEPYPPEWVNSRLQKLCHVLDAVRGAWGEALTVVSGYRSPAYNRALYEASEARAKAAGRAHGGVALYSEHVEGIAADVRPVRHPTAARVAQLHDLVLELYTTGKVEDLGGLGVYIGWVHLDVRERPADGHLARWNGTGLGSSR